MTIEKDGIEDVILGVMSREYCLADSELSTANKIIAKKSASSLRSYITSEKKKEREWIVEKINEELKHLEGLIDGIMEREYLYGDGEAKKEIEIKRVKIQALTDLKDKIEGRE